MRKYDNTKFYWLQLKEDFFEDDAIQWLEEQEKGKEYSLFYLKLCLKSLKTNGILIRNVGNLLVPYDAKKLAEITKTDFDTVVVAMQLLEKIGLIKILENGEIYLEQLEQMIGSQSIGAFKKQQQRRIGRTNVRQLSSKCPIEKEIEKEIDISSSYLKIIETFENEFVRLLSPMEIEKVESWTKSFQNEMIVYALSIAVRNNKKTFGYIEGILKNWKSCNYKTLEEVKQNEIKKEEQENEEIEIYDYDWLNEER